MSFGLPVEPGEEQLTYGGYLRIRELTGLQQLLSNPPQHDETLFIIIHQVYELWFKQLLHEIDAIIDSLNRDDVLSAHRLLRRCIEIEKVLVDQIAVLETMRPTDFLAFRDHLMPASGFQSAQFREVEIVSGLKERRFVEIFEEGSPERERLEAGMAKPTIGEAYHALLARRGFGEGGGDSGQTQPVSGLRRIYDEAGSHPDLFLLTESLIEYDETFLLWRLRHIQMVERMIGSRTGTGGSDGAAYLRKTVDRRFFPELWALRDVFSSKTADH